MLRLALLVFLVLAPVATAQAVPAGIRHRDLLVCDGASATPPASSDPSCHPERIDKVDPQNQEIWLLSTVGIEDPEASGSAPFAVYSGALASRELWWNGERIGNVGRPGASRAEETPGDLDGVTVVPSRLVRQGDNQLALRLSSFYNPVHVRTPVHYVYAQPVDPQDRELLHYYGPALATTGALLAAALYFGLAFLSDRRDWNSLCIALMAACAVGQLWLESLRGFVGIPYPMQVWRLSVIALLALGFALSMTAYVARRFAPSRWRAHVAASAVLAIAAAPFVPGFDGITLFALLLPAMVSIAAAVQGLVAGKTGAIAALLALLVFTGLIFLEQTLFLDRIFYLAVTALALVLFIDQALALRRARAAAADASRRAALLELELLRRRIAPHFLMNTLNALAEWVESDPKTGVKMIEALAGEFRLLSQIADRTVIPLGDEIALCRRHLEVMSYRVDRAFTLRTDSVDETAEIPPGVLHTLIENAFTHGRFQDGAEFVLTQMQEGDAIRLSLLAPPAETAGARNGLGGGEGLSYVRARLEQAFGAAAAYTGGPTPDGWLNELLLPRMRRQPA